MRRRWRVHRLGRNELAEAGLALTFRLQEAASGRFTYEPNRRLAGHLLKHSMHWFWFLIDPTIDATNYRAEQALRPAVGQPQGLGAATAPGPEPGLRAC